MSSHRHVILHLSVKNFVVGLSLILKLAFDPVYSIGDITIFMFCCFGLKFHF